MPEVIVAVAVVVFGIVGGLALINFSLNSVRVARNRSVAIAALQEGMEIVRALRDDNWHAGREWDEYISGRNLLGVCGNPLTYTVDAVVYHGLFNPRDGRSVVDCLAANVSSGPTLLYVTPEGRFTHDGTGANVPVSNSLRRIIQVTPSPPGCDGTPGNECQNLTVQGEVSFQAGSKVSTLRLVDVLTDWR